MAQIDPENVETIDVFDVFDAICVHFPRSSAIGSNTINYERRSIFEMTVAAFCFKNISD